MGYAFPRPYVMFGTINEFVINADFSRLKKEAKEFLLGAGLSPKRIQYFFRISEASDRPREILTAIISIIASKLFDKDLEQPFNGLNPEEYFEFCMRAKDPVTVALLPYGMSNALDVFPQGFQALFTEDNLNVYAGSPASYEKFKKYMFDLSKKTEGPKQENNIRFQKLMDICANPHKSVEEKRKELHAYYESLDKCSALLQHSFHSNKGDVDPKEQQSIAPNLK